MDPLDEMELRAVEHGILPGGAYSMRVAVEEQIDSGVMSLDDVPNIQFEHRYKSERDAEQ